MDQRQHQTSFIRPQQFKWRPLAFQRNHRSRDTPAHLCILEFVYRCTSWLRCVFRPKYRRERRDIIRAPVTKPPRTSLGATGEYARARDAALYEPVQFYQHRKTTTPAVCTPYVRARKACGCMSKVAYNVKHLSKTSSRRPTFELTYTPFVTY